MRQDVDEPFAALGSAQRDELVQLAALLTADDGIDAGLLARTALVTAGRRRRRTDGGDLASTARLELIRRAVGRAGERRGNGRVGVGQPVGERPGRLRRPPPRAGAPVAPDPHRARARPLGRVAGAGDRRDAALHDRRGPHRDRPGRRRRPIRAAPRLGLPPSGGDVRARGHRPGGARGARRTRPFAGVLRHAAPGPGRPAPGGRPGTAPVVAGRPRGVLRRRARRRRRPGGRGRRNAHRPGGGDDDASPGPAGRRHQWPGDAWLARPRRRVPGRAPGAALDRRHGRHPRGHDDPREPARAVRRRRPRRPVGPARRPSRPRARSRGSSATTCSWRGSSARPGARPTR